MKLGAMQHQILCHANIQAQGRSQTFIWVGSLEEKWTFLYDMIQIILWCVHSACKAC